MVYRKTSRVRAQLADKRGRILSAARHLVSEGGFGDASIDSIAAHAGVATGTVYRYFASKNELLAEVVRDASQYELEIIKVVRASRASAREKLSKSIEVFMMRAIRRLFGLPAPQEITLGQNTDELPTVDHRKTADVMLKHLPRGLEDCGVWLHRNNGVGHYILGFHGEFSNQC